MTRSCRLMYCASVDPKPSPRSLRRENRDMGKPRGHLSQALPLDPQMPSPRRPCPNIGRPNIGTNLKRTQCLEGGKKVTGIHVLPSKIIQHSQIRVYGNCFL
eukprot:GHVN01007560.1.p2 GENE.GHVN01007560.1~~GHVN01007560.1.p2  ORF type:complete len:102 (+),score=0.14 GHVN01007560.1:1276-1581(+)